MGFDDAGGYDNLFEKVGHLADRDADRVDWWADRCETAMARLGESNIECEAVRAVGELIRAVGECTRDPFCVTTGSDGRNS
jgi:hypothetical protein